MLNVANASKISIKRVIWAFTLMISAALLSIFYSHQTTGAFLQIDRQLPIYSVDVKEKNIALTFDVGDESTLKILDILDKYKVNATFFVLGVWVDRYPGELKEIDKRGHEIGNHSNTHPDMTKLSNSEIINDVSITDGKILSLINKTPLLFRFPSGEYNDSAVSTIKSIGHIPVQWSVDSIDWQNQGADLEYNRVISKVKSGSIILFHNNAKNTPFNLSRIIEKLKTEGYKFVKAGDLIYKKNYKIDYSGKQIPN